jgi:hypothetical protein
MSKKLDITGITNELSEGSAFFRSAPKVEERQVPSPSPVRPPRARALPSQQEPKTRPDAQDRPLIRRTFDLFEDQLDYLTRESLESRLAGKEGSMNAMVREALDAWIKDRKTSK